MTLYDIALEDWLPVGLGLTGEPFTWETIDFVTIHWPGATSRRGLGRDNAIAHIRTVDAGHRARKPTGHMAAYNVFVFQDGLIGEGRGDRRRNAANGTADANRRGISVQVVVRVGEHPTPQAIAAVRRVIAWVRSHRPHATINGHSDVRPTACPGPELLALVRDGAFEPDPTPDPPEEDDMPARYWRDERYHDVFQISPSVAPVPTLPEGAVVEVGRHHRTVRSCAIRCGFTTLSRDTKGGPGDWAKVNVSDLPDDPS